MWAKCKNSRSFAPLCLIKYYGNINYAHSCMFTHLCTHMCVCVWVNECVLLAPFEPVDWFSWNLVRVGHCRIDTACQHHVPESKIVLNKYVGYASSLIPKSLELFRPSWYARWLSFRRQVVQILTRLPESLIVCVCVCVCVFLVLVQCKWMLGYYFEMNHDHLLPCLSFHCTQCCVMYALKSIIIRIVGTK